jgi:hypothetical protein
MNSLNDLIVDLKRPDIWQEIVGLLLAVFLAYAITWWVSRRWSTTQAKYRLVSPYGSAAVCSTV